MSLDVDKSATESPTVPARTPRFSEVQRPVEKASSRDATVSIPQAPSGRDLLIIAAVAVFVRFELFTATTLGAGWSSSTFATLYDGPSYLRMAASMLDPSTVVAHLDRRVFIGYPALIALAGLAHLPLSYAALTISWLASGITAGASGALFQDRRIGWALAFFPPSFLMFSSTAMSEPAMLAFIVLGAYLIVQRERYVIGALLLGYAGVIRPVACFAVLGVLAALAYRWRVRQREIHKLETMRPQLLAPFRKRGASPVFLVAAIAGAVVIAGFAALRIWRGDAFEGVKIYARSDATFADHILAWPFSSLVMTPLRTAVPLWKVAYVWAYVAFVLIGCALATRRIWSLWASQSYELVILATVWLLCNTAFVLCTGSVWGFHYFDRHLLAALPPLVWAYSDFYPRRRARSISLGALSTLAAFLGLLTSPH